MEILEWFRDPAWQSVGVLVAIGSLFFFLFFRKRKKISYQIQATNLLTVKEEVKPKLKIIYENLPVEELNLVKLKISNSGNKPIVSDDFETPLVVSFPSKTQLFKVNVTGTNPENLKPSISIEGSSIVIRPLLLNPKDWITINILLSHFGEGVRVQARVAGVSELSTIDPSIYLTVMKYGFFAFIGSFTLAVINSILREYLPSNVMAMASYALLICFLLGIITMIVGFLRFGQLYFAKLD